MARAVSKTGSKNRSSSKSGSTRSSAKKSSNGPSKGRPTRARSSKSAGMSVPKPSRSGKPSRGKPIELYYWPTPNGWKISIMLEECRLAYEVRPINISAGEQFKPEFLAISPNNRMPAIVDPNGPGGKPISVFESGAILQYLGRKSGKFYPVNERPRVEVEQWLFWQMGGLGPMAGQAHHFRQYAPEGYDYAINRYTNEVNRLYGVMNKRLTDREFLAGPYSIADMACVGWAKLWKRQGQKIDEFPHFKCWLERVLARPAVQRGIGIRVEEASKVDMKDPKVWGVLFEQRARA